jgi:AAA+ superfamily predicted ATPase
MDERLLTTLDRPGIICIASSAVVGELDEMVLNRFEDKIEIEKPTVDELAEFLGERCEEWGIQCVEDAYATLCRLAELSDQIPGLALQVLRRAHRCLGKRLTMEMVEEHVFKIEELS